ncbi:MAG: hypothetical protein IE920_03095 [Thiotrichales bacterium]|nr:hypothetical protein [Thiotrichales bacterium]
MLIAIAISIRPLMAEGVMLHMPPTEESAAQDAASPHSSAMYSLHVMDSSMMLQHQLHHPQPMQAMQMSQTSAHVMDCCNGDMQHCNVDCAKGHCMVIAAAPVLAVQSKLGLATVETSQILTIRAETVLQRAISPELRPPLV